MEQEAVISNRTGLVIVGGLIAAITGGVIWMIIAIVTDYEIGIVAWAIGGLAGYAVVFLAKENVNTTHQVIAVIASILGIILGKYFILGYYYMDGISGIFHRELPSVFFNNLSLFFGGIDVIFVLLAVATAWLLPDRLAKKKAALQPDKPVDAAAEESHQSEA